MPKASSVCRVIKNSNYTTMSNYHLRSKNLSLKAIGLLSKVFSLPDDWDYSISGLVAICKENETAVKSTLNELKEWGYLIVTKAKSSETGRFIYSYDFYEYSEKDTVVFKKPAVIKPEISSDKSPDNPDIYFPDIESPGVENLPLENPPLENPPVDNPDMEIPSVENQGQLNTNKLNTDKSNKENKIKTNTAPYDFSDEKISSADRKKETRKLYAEDVKLSEREYQALCDNYSIPFADKCIEILNNYKLSSGKKYKSDYHAILSWVVGRTKQQYPELSAFKKPVTDNEDDYSNPFTDII